MLRALGLMLFSATAMVAYEPQIENFNFSRFGNGGDRVEFNFSGAVITLAAGVHF